MKVTACPFCGVASGAPHETQERCISALHGEIARMREMVSRVKGPARQLELVRPREVDEDEEQEDEDEEKVPHSA
jgi:hypothetical protein